jgi:hypothetical protein
MSFVCALAIRHAHRMYQYQSFNLIVMCYSRIISLILIQLKVPLNPALNSTTTLPPNSLKILSYTLS